MQGALVPEARPEGKPPADQNYKLWIGLSTRNKHSVEPLKIWKMFVTMTSTILINRLINRPLVHF